MVLVALVGPGLLAQPTAADQIADKRAQAARIAAALEAKGRQVSALAEEYDEARLRAERTAGQVQAAKSMLAQTDRLVDRARARVRTHAVGEYLRGGQVPVAQLLDAGSADELAVRQIYVRTLLGNEQAAIGALQDARELRQARRSQLEAAQRSARAVLSAVDARRLAAAQASASEEATLAQVRGDLRGLVDAESRRRQEEETRRAEADAARRTRAAAQSQARQVTGAAPRGVPGLDLVQPAPAGASRPPSSGAAAAVAEARRQLGKPYHYGAAGPDSFDCSGLILWAWRAGGRSLPHSSRAQYGATSRVNVSDIQPGDLTFYGRPIHHAGIYVGGGQMVEASETGTPVRYSSIYRRDMVGVGRVG